VGIVTERLARPVATDVRLHIEGTRLYSVQPQGEIDLFAGQDLVVLARYAGARDGATLVIEGQAPDGPVRWTGRVSLPARSGDNAFVARLWATQRVGYLSAERRRSGGNAELDAELRQLGERYGIPTELTSYLVQEPGMTVGGINRPSLLGSAAAPAARFESARAAAEQRAAKSVDELDTKDASLRRADNHVFALRDGVWTDTRQSASTRQLRVRAFSNAYFALVRRLPELGPLFGVAEQVRVQGRSVAIEVGPDGISELDDAALEAIVRDW
jgi:Ca-activated chloride channel family protein